MTEADRAMHDLCMVQTLQLEQEIWGQPMSPSVLARVRQLEQDMELKHAAQYGGSRAVALRNDERAQRQARCHHAWIDTPSMDEPDAAICRDCGAWRVTH